MDDMDTILGLDNQERKHQGNSSINYYSRTNGYLSSSDVTAKNIYYDLAVDYNKIKEGVVQELLNKDEDTLGIVLNCLRGHLEKFVEKPELLLNNVSDKISTLEADIRILQDKILYLDDQISGIIGKEYNDIAQLKCEIEDIKVGLRSLC